MRGELHLYFFGVNLAAELTGRGQDPCARHRHAEAQSGDARSANDRGIWLPRALRSTQWFGMLAPSGVPKPILEKISRDVAAAMALAGRVRAADQAGPRDRDQHAGRFRGDHPDDVARYGKMLRDAGLAVN